MKRIRLKYCGGCNPSYDRVEYVRALQQAAGNRIQWVLGDQEGVTAFLFVSGCERRCAEAARCESSGCRITCIQDAKEPPPQLVSQLLDERERP